MFALQHFNTNHCEVMDQICIGTKLLFQVRSTLLSRFTLLPYNSSHQLSFYLWELRTGQRVLSTQVHHAKNQDY